MGKFVNLQEWQLDNCNTLGMKGKGTSAKEKFDNGGQDFSAKINLQTNRSVVKRQKFGAKKQRIPTVFQYLRKAGYGKTYIELRTKDRVVGSTIVNTMVVVVNRFLFDNQVKNFGDKIVGWYYENNKEGNFSEYFS